MPAKPAAVKASTLKDRVRINCAASNGLKSLLMDRDITTSVAGAYPDVKRVMLQLQVDLTEIGDDELTLQVIKGIRYIDEVLMLFTAEGKADITAERRGLV